MVLLVLSSQHSPRGSLEASSLESLHMPSPVLVATLTQRIRDRRTTAGLWPRTTVFIHEDMRAKESESFKQMSRVLGVLGVLGVCLARALRRAVNSKQARKDRESQIQSSKLRHRILIACLSTAVKALVAKDTRLLQGALLRRRTAERFVGLGVSVQAALICRSPCRVIHFQPRRQDMIPIGGLSWRGPLEFCSIFSSASGSERVCACSAL